MKSGAKKRVRDSRAGGAIAEYRCQQLGGVFADSKGRRLDL